MRPLTLRTPKPLLRVAGTPLIEYHIRRLAAGGVRDLVINVSWLGAQIEDYCGDGRRWGVLIRYSREPVPLETAGGILRALPLLGGAPFVVVNGDVWMDFDVARLRARAAVLAPGEAHLLLAPNPPHHPAGDFSLRDGLVGRPLPGEATLTFTGVGLYTPAFFAGVTASSCPLRPLFERAIERGRLGGERHGGAWVDVGTPERLRELDAALRRDRGVPPAATR
jgi:MurNAc alpha-1-phosphate uridylyltransferase